MTPDEKHPYRDGEEPVESAPPPRSKNARVLSALAALKAARGDEVEAQQLEQRAEEARASTPSGTDRAATFRNLGHRALADGNGFGAESAYREAIALTIGHPSIADLACLATALRVLRRWSESEPTFKSVTREGSTPLLDDAPVLVAHEVAVLFAHLERPNAAIELLERALDSRDLTHLEVALLAHACAECRMDLRDFTTAHRDLERARSIREKQHGIDHPSYAATLCSLGRWQHLTGERRDQAEVNFGRAIVAASDAGNAIALAQTLIRRAEHRFDDGGFELAENDARVALSLLERAMGLEHAVLGRALRVWAQIAEARGRSAEARAMEERRRAILADWTTSEGGFE